jgi:hypothetical protein
MSEDKKSKAAARAALKRAAASPSSGARRRGRTTVRTLGRDDEIAGLTDGRNAEASRRGSARAITTHGPRPAASPAQPRVSTVTLPSPEVAQVCSVDGRRLTARLVVAHLAWAPGTRLTATQVGVNAWTLQRATKASLRRQARAEVADERGRIAFDLDFVREAGLRDWAAPLVFAADGALWLVDVASLTASPIPGARRKARKS